ncbi:unnamed protein product [Brassica rapa]|uniref:Uncharacterized protein n=2 Tax=Brassica TaxID=3705 RepID=A0A3P6DL95_BRACM|nr:unnamed protein product [Brassica napus]CAG7911393.1 unnamed protein product [Brassica rapa]CDY53964.1 BnaA10g29960D [Brassica napus]VDD19859.1 unnamed protein product [Brassica rapa]
MAFENNNNNTKVTKLTHISQNLSLSTLWKSIAISGALLFLLHTFAFNHPHKMITHKLFAPLEFTFSSSEISTSSSSQTSREPPTNISHLLFVIVGSTKTWRYRRGYIEPWWRPNITRGHVFLEKPPGRDLLPWPQQSPPFIVNKDSSVTNAKFKTQIRLFQSLHESFNNANKDTRWFVIADDDTLFFLDNLVKALEQYDHKKHYYIGMNSENVWSNAIFGFDMGYGGGGYALSYPTVETLLKRMEDCIARYLGVYSDLLSFRCLADLGIDLTMNKGIHQIDLHGDISGLLSAHPQSPLISLHHFDVINPIFPAMSRQESVNHLMKTAKTDQSRILQQTICYQRGNNWSVSVSWGYSVHVYQSVLPRNYLKRPLETFRPWKNVRIPVYTFNTRRVTNDPCEMPLQFFFDSVAEDKNQSLVTTMYKVKTLGSLPPCLPNVNQSAGNISQVSVIAATMHKVGEGIECCDVEKASSSDTLEVKIRACHKDEVLA